MALSHPAANNASGDHLIHLLRLIELKIEQSKFNPRNYTRRCKENVLFCCTVTATAKLRVCSALCDETLRKEEAEEAAAAAESTSILQLDVKQEELEKDQADRIIATLRQQIAAVRAADALDATAYHIPVSDFLTHAFDQSVRVSEQLQTRAQELEQRMRQVVAMRDNRPDVADGGDVAPVGTDPHTAAAQTIDDPAVIWDDFDFDRTPL